MFPKPGHGTGAADSGTGVSSARATEPAEALSQLCSMPRDCNNRRGGVLSQSRSQGSTSAIRVAPLEALREE